MSACRACLQFDISKIPDIYDVLKYNVIHNTSLALPGLREIYPTARALADLVVPQVLLDAVLVTVVDWAAVCHAHGYCLAWDVISSGWICVFACFVLARRSTASPARRSVRSAVASATTSFGRSCSTCPRCVEAAMGTGFRVISAVHANDAVCW